MAEVGRRGFFGAVAGMALAPSLWSQQTGKLHSPPKRTKAWIPSSDFLASLPTLMAAACLPGMSMAVVEDGSVVWTHSIGVLNAQTNELVRDTSLFEAASMSKWVFAYAVLQFTDRGKIDLDRPLTSYFKPSYLPDHPGLALITARHVLSHSSGLPNWGLEEDPESFKPAFKPGSFFSYSGEGFFGLQLVVEHLTGQSLDAFVRTQLFEPAGMLNSTFVGDQTVAPQTSWGHVGGEVAKDQGWRSVLSFTTSVATKWKKPVRDWLQSDWIRAAQEATPNAAPPKRVRFANAAASLLTTAADFAKFASLAMPPSNRFGWEVADATRTAMLRPQVPVREGTPHWWGLGPEIERHANGWRVGHEGNNDGRFASYSGIDPDRRRGLVVLTNSGSGFGVYQHVVRHTTGLDQISFIAEMHPPHASSRDFKD